LGIHNEEIPIYIDNIIIITYYRKWWWNFCYALLLCQMPDGTVLRTVYL